MAERGQRRLRQFLREYMTDAYGEPTGTDLARPDFVSLAESFRVRAVVGVGAAAWVLFVGGVDSGFVPLSS
ncbi:hypothetical protein GCM10009540_69280 [Streptomyces turgidiscabies]